MNFRLFLSALLLVSVVTGPPCLAEGGAAEPVSAGAAAETDRQAGADSASESKSNEGSRRPGKKLKKTAFPEDKFSILLPADYSAAQKGSSHSPADKGCNTYTAADYPHGLMMAMCLTAPEHSTFSPLVLKELVEKLTANKKSLDDEGAVTVNGRAGRQWDVTNAGDAPQDGTRVRGFIVGRKMYILMAYGTKPWLNSDGIKQFMDSLEVMQ